MGEYHTAALLKEVIENFRIEKGKTYIDATLGGGGHAFEILRLGGRVLGIDVDEDALEEVRKILRDKDIKILGEKKDEQHNIVISQYPNIALVKGNFRNIDEIAHLHGIDAVDGIIFDLGVSSHQLLTPERGFSFEREAELDMRMDKSLGVKASDLVNILTKGELYDLFNKLGQERYAFAVANAIVGARKIKRIETTKELSDVVTNVVRKKIGEIHSATRIFQALRIAVNDELSALEEALPKAVDLLKKNGRMAVISFHSLEDRIVKYKFREFENKKKGIVVTKKPIIPGSEEVERNKRSRSAKLRIFERS